MVAKGVGVPKQNSPVFHGGVWADGATSHEEKFLLESNALVLDVDDSAQFTLPEIQERFGEVCFIAYNSYSVSPDDPKRWRLILPLAEPISPLYYRSLWHWVNDNVFDGTLPTSSQNPGRLGYYGTLASPEGLSVYTWHFNQAPLFDWAPLMQGGHLTPSTPQTLAKFEVGEAKEKKAYWPDRASWLKRAKKYYTPRAVGVGEGGRYGTLFPIACQLWWDWGAASYDNPGDLVYEVLEEVNKRFAVPKDEEGVVEPVHKGYDRVFRVQGQQEMYGRRLEPTPITGATLESFRMGLSKRMQATKDAEKRAVTSVVLSMVKNCLSKQKPLCESSQFQYIGDFLRELANEFPDTDPEQVGAEILPAFSLLWARYSESVPVEYRDYDVVLSRFKVAQAQAQKAREAREAAREEERKRLLMSAFGGSRDTPYTEAEYREFEQKNELTEQTWILQRRKEYYVFFNGTYQGPFITEEIENSIVRWLAPAESRVRIHTLSKDGRMVRKRLSEIMESYGSVFKTIEYDYNRTHAQFVKQGAKLVLPAAERALLTPKYSEDVDAWLRILSGDKYPLLEKYLAAFPNLKYPLVCLYLYGPAGTGKSAFAKGLSKLFAHGGIINMNSYLKQFNSFTQYTPLIVCDEHIDEGVKRQGKLTALFRDAIQSTEHELRTKYQEDKKLHGAIRIMICANNPNVLTDEREYLGTNDVKATAERFLSIAVPEEAGRYIQNVITPERFEQIIDGEFAQHVLYLAEHVPVDWSKRFVVRDVDDAAVRQAISTGRDEVSAVFSLVHAALLVLSKNRSSNGLKDAVEVSAEGEILVRHTLLNSWDTLMPQGVRRPKELERGPRAMMLVCTDRRVQSRGVKFRELDIEQFKAWVDAQGLDWDDVYELILKLARAAEATSMAEDKETAPQVGEA
jgi:hypothetical protein